MLILGFETSNVAASVAVIRDGELIAQYTLCNTKTHSETVMPIAERLLADLQIAPGDLDALAVDIGPGSFTGVRIGVCAANAMALALHIPVFGIDVMRVLYQPIKGLKTGVVCTLLDARNQNGYAALFENGERIIEAQAVVMQEFVQELPERTLYVGDGAVLLWDTVLSKRTGARLAPMQYAVPTAAAVCACAYEDWKTGIDINEKEASPLYLRPSQAERMWAKTHDGA